MKIITWCDLQALVGKCPDVIFTVVVDGTRQYDVYHIDNKVILNEKGYPIFESKHDPILTVTIRLK